MGIPPADTEDEVAELKRVLSARETELSGLREAFGEFASAAGHELKSPLNKMIAFVKLLQDECARGRPRHRTPRGEPVAREPRRRRRALPFPNPPKSVAAPY